MKVILVMVMSADGKTTKWDNPDIYKWTSTEDQNHFFSTIEKNNLIIMGRKTFNAARSIIKLSPRILRIVLTKTPEKYAPLSVPGQLEFTSDPPEVMVTSLKARGYKQALLVGGEETNRLFLKAKLVNEIWITIEPRIFGFGNSLTAEEKLDIALQLKSIKKLNKKGSILLKYQVS